MKSLKKYVNYSQNAEDDEQKQIIGAYIFQIIMRKGTTEKALMVNFEFGLKCVTPLGDVLGQAPFDFSFIYGDNDWVRSVEKDYAKNPIETKNKKEC